MVLYCMCRKGRSYETTEGFGLVEHRPQGPTEGTPQLLIYTTRSTLGGSSSFQRWSRILPRLITCPASFEAPVRLLENASDAILPFPAPVALLILLLSTLPTGSNRKELVPWLLNTVRCHVWPGHRHPTLHNGRSLYVSMAGSPRCGLKTARPKEIVYLDLAGPLKVCRSRRRR